jgi:hypothetical protein
VGFFPAKDFESFKCEGYTCVLRQVCGFQSDMLGTPSVTHAIYRILNVVYIYGMCTVGSDDVLGEAIRVPSSSEEREVTT